jgi:hypothetical protein
MNIEKLVREAWPAWDVQCWERAPSEWVVRDGLVPEGGREFYGSSKCEALLRALKGGG